jgi:hypothetical protein
MLYCTPTVLVSMMAVLLVFLASYGTIVALNSK